jgi:hypothetical protein
MDQLKNDVANMNQLELTSDHHEPTQKSLNLSSKLMHQTELLKPTRTFMINAPHQNTMNQPSNPKSLKS